MWVCLIFVGIVRSIRFHVALIVIVPISLAGVGLAEGWVYPLFLDVTNWCDWCFLEQVAFERLRLLEVGMISDIDCIIFRGLYVVSLPDFHQLAFRVT